MFVENLKALLYWVGALSRLNLPVGLTLHMRMNGLHRVNFVKQTPKLVSLGNRKVGRIKKIIQGKIQGK